MAVQQEKITISITVLRYGWGKDRLSNGLYWRAILCHTVRARYGMTSEALCLLGMAGLTGPPVDGDLSWSEPSSKFTVVYNIKKYHIG